MLTYVYKNKITVPINKLRHCSTLFYIKNSEIHSGLCKIRMSAYHRGILKIDEEAM